MTYLYECLICGKEFEIDMPMNAKHEAYHCGIEARRVFTVPYTNKDQMYNFTDNHSFKQGYDIHSKRQYLRICKKEGSILLSPSERKSLKPKMDKDYAPARKKCAENIMKKVAKDGLMSKFKKLQDALPTKKES
ncbi:hypothetical protein LCGC14_0434920 [marine sediment metagenome]|uniref:C2H2-type domain-containing protein n=1 Tax=marine sediment metagenome TaxID=412755 RepID=A0A0F9SM06_9ZZZZ